MDREARVSDGGHQDEVRGGARALPLPESDWTVVGITAAYLLTALAAAGRHARAPAAQRGGRLLADGVNFDDIEAFELRNAGRVEVFVFVWQQTRLEYYHVLQQRAPSGTGVVRHTVQRPL